MADYIITIERAFNQPVEDALRQAECIITSSSAPDRFSTALWKIALSTDKLDEASIETLVLEVNRGSYFDITDGESNYDNYGDDDFEEDDGESENLDDEEMSEFDDDWDLHPYYPA